MFLYIDWVALRPVNARRREPGAKSHFVLYWYLVKAGQGRHSLSLKDLVSINKQTLNIRFAQFLGSVSAALLKLNLLFQWRGSRQTDSCTFSCQIFIFLPPLCLSQVKGCRCSPATKTGSAAAASLQTAAWSLLWADLTEWVPVH